MLERNADGVLTLDLDKFFECLDGAQAELERLRELAGHITELTYQPDLGEYKDTFSDDADRMDWDFALRVRRGRRGVWKIYGYADVVWNVTPHWAPRWAGVAFATLDDALAELPDAMAAHTEACHDYLRVAAERLARRRQRDQEPEPEGDAHDCG